MRYVRKRNPDPHVADAWVSYWRRPDGSIDAEPMTQAEYEALATSRQPFPPSIEAEHRLLGHTLGADAPIFTEPFTPEEQAAVNEGRAYKVWGWVRASDGAVHVNSTAEWRFDTASGDLEPGDVTDAWDFEGRPWVACVETGVEVDIPPAQDVVLDRRVATLVDVPTAEIPARIAAREAKAAAFREDIDARRSR